MSVLLESWGHGAPLLRNAHANRQYKTKTGSYKRKASGFCRDDKILCRFGKTDPLGTLPTTPPPAPPRTAGRAAAGRSPPAWPCKNSRCLGRLEPHGGRAEFKIVADRANPVREFTVNGHDSIGNARKRRGGAGPCPFSGRQTAVARRRLVRVPCSLTIHGFPGRILQFFAHAGDGRRGAAGQGCTVIRQRSRHIPFRMHPVVLPPIASPGTRRKNAQ